MISTEEFIQKINDEMFGKHGELSYATVNIGGRDEIGM